MSQSQQSAVYSWSAEDVVRYFAFRGLSERLQRRAEEVKLTGYNLVNTPRINWKLLFPHKEDRNAVMKMRTEILRREPATRKDLRKEDDIWTVSVGIPVGARLLVDLPSSSKLIHLWRLVHKNHPLEEGTKFRFGEQWLGSGVFGGDIRDQHTLQEYGLTDGCSVELVLEKKPLHISGSTSSMSSLSPPAVEFYPSDDEGDNDN